jgi:peptidoglycan/LPS O-acetylase OafA/YrhL
MRLVGAQVPYTHELPRQLVTSLVWEGQAGVQIFFAVSGFLITATSIQRWGTLEKVSLRNFYLIRFARIAPLLLALLAVLSTLDLLHVDHFVVSQRDGGLPNALFAALTFRTGLLEAARGYLPGNWDILWSLSVEELFYLFFPLACRLLYREKQRGAWLVGLLLIFVCLGPFSRTIFTRGNPVWQEYSYLGGMDAIALGCLTALVVAGRHFTRRGIVSLLGCGLVLVIFCLTCEPQLEVLGLEKLGLAMTLLAVGACMLIAVAAQTRWQVNRIFAPVLAYGRRSYEVYLTHMFVVFACFDFFVRHGKPLRLVPLLFIVTIILAGILGELVGRFYSEPTNRWLRTRLHTRSREGKSTLASVVSWRAHAK